MVEEVAPDDLAKWEALAIHDGWGEENQRLAALCAEIHNAALINANKSGGTVKPDELKSADDFTPRFKWQKKPRKVRSGIQSDAMFEAGLKRLAGF